MTVPPDPSGHPQPGPPGQQYPQGSGPYQQHGGQYPGYTPSAPPGQQPGPYQAQPEVYPGQSGFYPGQPYVPANVGQQNQYAAAPFQTAYPQQFPQRAPEPFPEPIPGRPRGKRRKKALVISGSIAFVAIAALLVLGFLTPGFLTSTQVSANSVQSGIKQVITDSYGLSGYGAVSCPRALPTKPGAMMTCTVEHNGTTMPVVVESRGDSGEYVVHPPGQRPSSLPTPRP